MKNGKIPWLETNLLSFVRHQLWQILLHPWGLPLMLVFDCCPKYFANNTADFTPFRGKSIIQIFFSSFLFGQSRKIQCCDVILLVHFLKKHVKVIWLQDCSSMWHNCYVESTLDLPLLVYMFENEKWSCIKWLIKCGGERKLRKQCHYNSCSVSSYLDLSQNVDHFKICSV